jgi:hypothetical protein
MERFVTRYDDRIVGILTGFDRMLFRGTLRSISYPKGAEIWLSSRHVLLKDFATFAADLTARLKAHATQLATDAQRPVEYLESSRISKEERARTLQQRDGIAEGLIAIFSCVEPCRAVTVRSNRATRRLGFVVEDRKCAHLYFYYADRDFGLMHLRLQTWFPFTLQVCINGREWLVQQLTRAGIGFDRARNCVTRVDDVVRAQRLLEQLSTRRWARLLRRLAERVNPLIQRSAGLALRSYYWSLQESEFATDVLFRSAAQLAAIYPALTRHAIEAFGSEDVLRFLGRRMGGRSTGEVTSSYLRRAEGLRVKHHVEENSIKMYDKAGCVLRIEVTINQPRRFLVYRERTRQGQTQRCWGKMRKGIADLPGAWSCRALRMRGISTRSVSFPTPRPCINSWIRSVSVAPSRTVPIAPCAPSRPMTVRHLPRCSMARPPWPAVARRISGVSSARTNHPMPRPRNG